MKEKYMIRIKAIVFALLFFLGVYANIGGQSGSVNPYNKYMSGSVDSANQK